LAQDMLSEEKRFMQITYPHIQKFARESKDKESIKITTIAFF